MLLRITKFLSQVVFVGVIFSVWGHPFPGAACFQSKTVPVRLAHHEPFWKELSSFSICALSRCSKSRALSSRLYVSMDNTRNEKLVTALASDVSDETVPSTWNQALHRFFLGDIGPPLVVVSIVGFIYARVQLPQTLSITDATIFITSIVIWWFQEYFFHKALLHSPFDWIGKTIHSTHHNKNYFHVSIDPPALLLGWLFAAHLILKSFMPWHLCLSATIGYAIAGLFYEWSHYIVHTRVKAPVPSQDNSLFRPVASAAANLFSQMRNNHIGHHRVDDSYWYAFSVPAMDDAFGTNPDLNDLVKHDK